MLMVQESVYGQGLMTIYVRTNMKSTYLTGAIDTNLVGIFPTSGSIYDLWSPVNIETPALGHAVQYTSRLTYRKMY